MAAAVFFAPVAAHAAKVHSLYFGAGLLFQNVGRTATSSTGETGLFGELNPQIAVSGRLGLGGDFFFVPGYQGVLLGKAVFDDAANITLHTFTVQASYQPGFFDLHAGTGLQLQVIAGSGGTTTLDNGNTTSQFALPGRTSTASLAVLTLGLGYSFNRSPLRLDLDGLVTGAASSERRAVSMALTVSYGVGG